jgi:hypothetical protein
MAIYQSSFDVSTCHRYEQMPKQRANDCTGDRINFYKIRHCVGQCWRDQNLIRIAIPLSPNDWAHLDIRQRGYIYIYTGATEIPILAESIIIDGFRVGRYSRPMIHKKKKKNKTKRERERERERRGAHLLREAKGWWFGDPGLGVRGKTESRSVIESATRRTSFGFRCENPRRVSRIREDRRRAFAPISREPLLNFP